MKNINVSKITAKPEEIESFVQFEIAKWEKLNALNSLENPNDITQAREFLQKFVEKNYKYYAYIGNIPELLDKVLYIMFAYDKKIEDALDFFLKKNTSVSAKSKVDAMIIIWEYANKAYKPMNNGSFKTKKIA